MIYEPHLPITGSKTAAVDGFGSFDSCSWSIMPYGRTDSKTYISRQPEKPSSVAVPTAFGFLACLDITTAPSIPINAHRVTNIVPSICFARPPSERSRSPQKSNENRSELKNISVMTIKNNSGAIFATVPIRLIIVACLMPFRTSALKPHISNEPPIME